MTSKTHFIFIVDMSSSMEKFEKAPYNMVQNKLNSLITDGGNYTCTIWTFNSQSTRLAENVHPRVAQNCLNALLRPWGNTALFSTMIKAITESTHDIEAAVLVNIITDGKDNASPVTAAQVAQKLNVYLTNPNWTITLETPKGYKDRLVRLGFPSGNIIEWEQTTKGFEENANMSQAALLSYVDDRKRGVTRKINYYNVTTNVAVDTTKLTQLASKHKFYSVEKEVRIDEFVQEKTGKPYQKGTCFYQLTKTERIQPSKKVFLVEKGKKDVLTGPTREMIGLTDPTKEAKVTPGNHQNWDVFVESQSDNRKLVRGTKLLYLEA